MSNPIQPISELGERAKRALVQELGVVDTMRFLNQFRAGNGNYAAEREQLFKDESVGSIATSIKSQRTDKI
ncbi:hypothetical protein [Salinisphaera japonica]|uniref:hypothetical protein n=1 Tax=Salinisphaera japonica TaxID=1304270 RepID=UPI000F4BF210|nr:hypothetical protein [Salinisphaera japonica]